MDTSLIPGSINEELPAFYSKTGLVLNGTNAIVCYVANYQLFGESRENRAAILQWMEFGDQQIFSAVHKLTYQITRSEGFKEAKVNKTKKVLAIWMHILNMYLKDRNYLVGDCITLADISVVADLLDLYQLGLEPLLDESYTEVNQWFDNLIQQEKFKLYWAKWDIFAMVYLIYVCLQQNN